MAGTIPAVQTADQRAVRHGDKTVMVWIPEQPAGGSFPIAGILNAAGTDIKSGGPFCTQIDMPDIVKAPINAVDNVMLSGGKSPISYTDGVKIEPFAITLLGNALSAFYAAIGQSPTTQPAMIHSTVKYGKKGHMLIYGFGVPVGGGAPVLMRTSLLLNLCVMIDKLPGYTPDGVTSQEITFYTDRSDGDVIELQGNKTFVWEEWADNATVLNGSIPGTTLDVGTGNNSYTSATTPTTFVFNTAATGIDQRFAYISVNGVRQNTANGTTFAAPTITLPTATVVPATVLAIYAIDVAALTNAQIPNWGSGTLATGWHAWLGA